MRAGSNSGRTTSGRISKRWPNAFTMAGSHDSAEAATTSAASIKSASQTAIQASTHSATLAYLKAVKAAGTKDTEAVAKKLKELPVDDQFAQGGKVLANGRMVHDLYLFEVKKPSESKKPWDYYKQLAVVPGDKAFPSAKDSGCPLTK